MEHLAIRNNFRVTQKFLITKSDCTIHWQIWQIFDPYPPKTCRRLKWMVSYFPAIYLHLIFEKSRLMKLIFCLLRTWFLLPFKNRAQTRKKIKFIKLNILKVKCRLICHHWNSSYRSSQAKDSILAPFSRNKLVCTWNQCC